MTWNYRQIKEMMPPWAHLVRRYHEDGWNLYILVNRIFSMPKCNTRKCAEVFHEEEETRAHNKMENIKNILMINYYDLYNSSTILFFMLMKYQNLAELFFFFFFNTSHISGIFSLFAENCQNHTYIRLYVVHKKCL